MSMKNKQISQCGQKGARDKQVVVNSFPSIHRGTCAPYSVLFANNLELRLDSCNLGSKLGGNRVERQFYKAFQASRLLN
jgi:hypothetical protein